MPRPTNERLVLAERPAKGPVTAKTFRRETVSLGPLGDGEVLVRVEYSAIVRVLPFCRLANHWKPSPASMPFTTGNGGARGACWRCLDREAGRMWARKPGRGAM